MFHNQILVQLEVGYHSFGADLDMYDYHVDHKLSGSSLDTRLLIGSKLGFESAPGFNFIFAAGAFASKVSGGGDGILGENFDSDIKLSKLDINTLNMGLSGMIGFEFYGFTMSIAQDFGLTNLAKKGSLRTSSWSFKSGYIYYF